MDGLTLCILVDDGDGSMEAIARLMSCVLIVCFLFRLYNAKVVVYHLVAYLSIPHLPGDEFQDCICNFFFVFRHSIFHASACPLPLVQRLRVIVSYRT